jgi:hypothetical protein
LPGLSPEPGLIRRDHLQPAEDDLAARKQHELDVVTSIDMQRGTDLGRQRQLPLLAQGAAPDVGFSYRAPYRTLTRRFTTPVKP